ncbi:MAG: HAD-IA family hydrolase [Acidaminococcus sp.]|nr:HAD-IA family hydrolase [Acidaminococcus sp.]
MKIIIFDLFDTLLDKVWFDYDKGLSYLADKYFDHRCDELKRYAEEYRERFMLDRNETQREKSFFDQLAFYENKFGKKPLKSRDEIEWEVFSICREERLAVGAKSLLGYLFDRGYTLAVLSNSIFSSKTLKKYMAEFGIEQYFTEVVSSADIIYRKPSVEAFRFILNKLGVPPSPEIYFIGNKLDKDAMGALDAGLTSILISKEAVIAPCIILQDLNGVKHCLESSYLYVNSIAEKESLIDGPGLRTVVFFQGCTRACKDCHNPMTWPLASGERYSVKEFAGILKKKAKNKKITFSGGEPLLQVKAITELAKELKEYDLCMYTGMSVTDVPDELKGILHYLKVGSFQREKRTTVSPYIGSTNQLFIDLRREHETINK